VILSRNAAAGSGHSSPEFWSFRNNEESGVNGGANRAAERRWWYLQVRTNPSCVDPGTMPDTGEEGRAPEETAMRVLSFEEDLRRPVTTFVVVACSAAVVAACGGRGPPSTNSGPSSPVPVEVPAPPADVRDRIGIYAWGFDATSWPGSPDRLNWAAAKVAGLGARTIRIYLGPADPYQVLGATGAFDLANAAASQAYSALFANPSFETILITTYSAADQQNAWQSGYGSDQAEAETAEIARLGTYLLTTFPGKTFILLNWEGDNAVNAFANNPGVWDAYTAWINARAAGVVNARAMAPASSSHLYSAVEFNAVRNLKTGLPCDTGANKCVLSMVVPNVPVDYYSYSAWNSFLKGLTPAQMATQLQTDLSTALGWAAQRRDVSVIPARFIVGEFGAPRDREDYGECTAMSHIEALIGAVPAWGAARAIFWQIIDNAPPATTLVNTEYGLFKASGATSLAAQLFQTLYQNQVPTPPPTPSCPVVQSAVTTPPGVAIGPTTVLSLEGTGFSNAGNVVHVREAGGRQWDVTTGSPAWSETPSEIHFTLPGIGPSQTAFVTMTDAEGVDSNAQALMIGP
jgi:hypothetical protein